MFCFHGHYKSLVLDLHGLRLFSPVREYEMICSSFRRRNLGIGMTDGHRFFGLFFFFP